MADVMEDRIRSAGLTAGIAFALGALCIAMKSTLARKTVVRMYLSDVSPSLAPASKAASA